MTLPSVLDLDAIEHVRDVLLDALDEGGVDLCGKDVERVSTNGLMLLISAAETARRNGVEFGLSRPSPAMRAAIGRLGLGGAFSAMMRD